MNDIELATKAQGAARNLTYNDDKPQAQPKGTELPEADIRAGFRAAEDAWTFKGMTAWQVWLKACRWFESRVAQAPALAHDPAYVPGAMEVVTGAMRADPDYAWSWHCNIAMSFVDAGGDSYTANQGAARFMRLLANVEPAHELPAPGAAHGDERAANLQSKAADGDLDSIIYKCRTATAVEARAYLRTALAALTFDVQSNRGTAEPAANCKKPFFAHDPENRTEWFATEAEAVAHARSSLNYYQDWARSDGEWSGDVEDVKIGRVTHIASESGNEEDGYSYSLHPLAEPVPSTAPVDGDVRELRKWLNEQPNRPIDRDALARLLHAVENAQPVGEIVTDCDGAAVLGDEVSWRASMPPAGTKLYTAPAPCAAVTHGSDMLEPLIYAAMMHNGKPKTVAEFERVAANVADMLQRRAADAHEKPVAVQHKEQQ